MRELQGATVVADLAREDAAHSRLQLVRTPRLVEESKRQDALTVADAHLKDRPAPRLHRPRPYLEHLGDDGHVLVDRQLGERGEFPAAGVAPGVVAEQIAHRRQPERLVERRRRAPAEGRAELDVEGGFHAFRLAAFHDASVSCMTRIIAGFAGSLRLAVPGSGTRPTSDRVREAIFSALEARDAIAGMRCLDLYAGSGALGLEAASRGAAHITLVDTKVSVAKQNAALIAKQAPRGVKPVIETSSQAVQPFLAGARTFWDLVFIDPPYELSSDEVTQNLEALTPRLTPGAVVVLERSSRSAQPVWPAALVLDRRKDYGDTVLYWLELAGEELGGDELGGELGGDKRNGDEIS